MSGEERKVGQEVGEDHWTARCRLESIKSAKSLNLIVPLGQSVDLHSSESGRREAPVNP